MSDDLEVIQATTSVVFGNTFSLYSDDEYEEFIEFLRVRLRRNGINADEAFAGKRCLDAGCGGGRGTVLMAESAAAEVIAFDLSKSNIETTQLRAEQRQLANIHVIQGSIHELPFPNEHFDVVWSNGVLHHTGDTDLALKEVSRVLKPGGWMWLYLYGSGGIYWHVIDWVRDCVREHDVDVQACIDNLRVQGVPVRRIAEWIDDWFVPVLQRYTREDVRTRLVALGFGDARPLDLGTEYDTSQRRVGADAHEVELMGDGDVRFWCQKTSEADPIGRPLTDAPNGKGSPWTDGVAVHEIDNSLEKVSVSLRNLQHAAGPGLAYPIMVCGRVHSAVRAELEQTAALDVARLCRIYETIASECDDLARVVR